MRCLNTTCHHKDLWSRAERPHQHLPHPIPAWSWGYIRFSKMGMNSSWRAGFDPLDRSILIILLCIANLEMEIVDFRPTWRYLPMENKGVPLLRYLEHGRPSTPSSAVGMCAEWVRMSTHNLAPTSLNLPSTCPSWFPSATFAGGYLPATGRSIGGTPPAPPPARWDPRCPWPRLGPPADGPEAGAAAGRGASSPARSRVNRPQGTRRAPANCCWGPLPSGKPAENGWKMATESHRDHWWPWCLLIFLGWRWGDGVRLPESTVLKAALVDGPSMASVSLSPMQSNTPEQQSSAMLSNSPLNHVPSGKLT